MLLNPLPRSFYLPSAALVAPQLLGHLLIRNTPDGPCGGPIVETEAYVVDDPACHAFKGETPRNTSMYGPPGHAYVYLIYGFHFCVNVVCCRKGKAEALLIRAIEAALGEPLMRARRPVTTTEQLTSGPGKLCAALAINRKLDGVDLCDSASLLFIARNPDHKKFLLEKSPMVTTTRVGITQAADRPLRFFLQNSPFVSRHR